MRKSRIQGTWLTLLMLLLVMLVWYFARLALLPEGPMEARWHYLLLIAQEALLFGIPALMLRPWWSHGVHRSPRWRSGCWLGLLAGVTLAVAAVPVLSWWSSLMRVAPQETPLPASGLDWTLMVLAMVVVPALVEEAFFRGGILCGLARGVGGKAAFALTVVIFTMMHGRVAGLPAHLACGALLTLIMLRYGKLWPSIAAHLAYNAATLGMGWAGVTPSWSALPAAAALMVIVAVMLRKTVWCDHKEFDVVDITLGCVTMAVLGFYFMVQLREGAAESKDERGMRR